MVPFQNFVPLKPKRCVVIMETTHNRHPDRSGSESPGKRRKIALKMNVQKTVVVNASHADTIYFDGFEGKSYEIVNCMGETVEKGILKNLFALNIPTSGMVFIK